MKNNLLTLLFLFSSCLVAQAFNADSTRKITLSKKLSIEDRSNAYAYLIQKSILSEPDSAEHLLRELKAIAVKTNDAGAWYSYHFALSKCIHSYDIDNPLDSMVFHLKKAQQYVKKLKKEAIYKEAEIYYELSNVYMRHSDVETALKYAETSFKIAQQKGDVKSIGVSAISLGNTLYYGKNEYKKALRYYQISDSINMITNNTADLTFVKMGIGHIFLNLGDYDQAEKYYTESLKFYKQDGDEYNVFYTQDRLAEIDIVRKKYKKALETFRQSYAYYKRTNIKMRIAENAGYLSEIFLALDMPDSSIHYANVGYAEAKSSGDTSRLLSTMRDLSNAYFMKKDYSLSYNFAKNIYQLSNTEMHQIKKKEALSIMHRAQKKLGNNLLAYDHLLEYLAVKDSMAAKRQGEQVIELEKKYKTAQKEKQLALANQQKTFFKKQRWLFGGIAALLGVFVVLYRRQINKKKINELQAEMAQIQLASLKSQMNPHFMFNSINSIKGLIINEAAEAAADQLTRFSKLMRSTLNYSSEKEISIQQEIEFITLYSELERFKGKFPVEMNFTVDKDIDVEQVFIIPFLIQPFVENAFKHAFNEMDERRPQIDIRFKKENAMLHIEIEDNGIGVKNASASAHVSKGTSLVEKRLELHNKKKNNVSITFKGENQGTIATLKIKN